MPRRSAEQHIAHLETQIAALKAKAAADRAKKDPALKFVSQAIRFIDTASGETKDAALRGSLEEARSTLSACLQLQGLTVARKSTRRTARAGGSVDRETLLAYIRTNPGLRGEQIAGALGTDAKTMRPVMRELIAERRVRTQGERRGMMYSPV
jgi:hypothetical protein